MLLGVRQQAYMHVAHAMHHNTCVVHVRYVLDACTCMPRATGARLLDKGAQRRLHTVCDRAAERLQLQACARRDMHVHMHMLVHVLVHVPVHGFACSRACACARA